MAVELRRRSAPRAEVSLGVTLTRAGNGAAVEGRTRDLGPGGMLVATGRPLRVDEQLDFAVALEEGPPVTGRAHVVREHACEVYGLRFDRLATGDAERLAALATQPDERWTRAPERAG